MSVAVKEPRPLLLLVLDGAEDTFQKCTRLYIQCFGQHTHLIVVLAAKSFNF